jgi:hypothetical protein
MPYPLSDQAKEIMETEINYAEQTKSANTNSTKKLTVVFDEIMQIRGEVGTVSAPDEEKLIEKFTEDLLNSMYTFIDSMQILEQERRLKMLREEMNEREKMVDHKRGLIEKRQQGVFVSESNRPRVVDR